MTQKEMRRLTRKQLLELLLAQTQQVNQLQETVDSLTAQLNECTIAAPAVGTIDDAPMHLSHVFEAAKLAADVHLVKLRKYEEYCAQLETQARERAQMIIQEAREKSAKIQDDANTYWEQTKQLVNECLKQVDTLQHKESE